MGDGKIPMGDGVWLALGSWELSVEREGGSFDLELVPEGCLCVCLRSNPNPNPNPNLRITYSM